MSVLFYNDNSMCYTFMEAIGNLSILEQYKLLLLQ